MARWKLRLATWIGILLFIYSGWLIAGQIGAGISLAIFSVLLLVGIHFQDTKRKSADGGGM